MARKKAGTRRSRRRPATGGKATSKTTKRKTTKSAGRKRARTKRAGGKARRRAAGRRDSDALLGPPPAEALYIRSDLERAAERLQRGDAATSPRLTGGDVDADWQRAASTGEEAVGGSAVTPDQDVVDHLGEALGVPRAPDESFRPSAELLEERDARRGREEG
jgi:Family of unknown function (DUF6335)